MAKSSTGGTKEKPWKLATPSGLSPPALVVTVGKAQLRYDLSCMRAL